MPMKLKTVEVEIDGQKTVVALTQDGKPLYEADDGREVAHDADHAVTTISRLNREAQGHRQAKEDAEKALKAFEGIEDPAKALEALTTVQNLQAGDLKTAAQVEELKASVEKAVKANFEGQIRQRDDQIKTLTGERDGYKTSLDKEVIGGNFARSKYIAEKLLLPPDLAEAAFGRHFAVENGKLTAKDANGSPIVSRQTYGEATFDEAIEQLVEAYPNKATILKGSGSSGSNGQGGDTKLGAKQIARSEFMRLPPDAQHAKIRDGFTLTEA